jgi:hypothetical protein
LNYIYTRKVANGKYFKMRNQKRAISMTAKQKNLAILLCAIAFFSAYFVTHKHIALDDYDRLML